MSDLSSSHQLVVTALGNDRPGIVHEFIKACTHTGCNLLHTRMASFGQEISISVWLSGGWGAIAKMEALLPTLGRRLQLTLQAQRTEDKPLGMQLMTYTAQAITVDRPGILFKLTDFFQDKQIWIQEINAYQYLSLNRTRMAHLTLQIDIGPEVHIASLRDQFIEYCDQHNIDALLEPYRHQA